MSREMNFDSQVKKIIQLALSEDLGEIGDLTSNLLLVAGGTDSAKVVSKDAGLVAGLQVCEVVFKTVDPAVSVQLLVSDGTAVEPDDAVLNVQGKARSILAAERTALNFLQRLSGIATETSKFVNQVSGTKCKILDTRKTTPGLRTLEKYAVRVGGGYNHRFGLYDMVLLKENHIKAAGGIEVAVEHIRTGLNKSPHENCLVEVETTSLAEVKQALQAGANRILLDNMTLEEIRAAVDEVDGQAEIEASGGIDLHSVRAIAEAGVDYISVGALTHSAKALDLSLLFN